MKTSGKRSGGTRTSGKTANGNSGRGRKPAPVKVPTLGENDSPLVRDLEGFLSQVHTDRKESKGDGTSLDAQRLERLNACKKMIAETTNLTETIKISNAVVAYEIAVGKLWRGEYDSKIECIKKQMHVCKSAAYNLIGCGRVVTMVADSYFKDIPNSFAALTPFASLKDEADILEAFEIALNDPRTQRRGITKAIAKRAVSQVTGESVSPKPARKTGSTKPVSTKKAAIELGKQMEALGEEGKITFKVIEPLLNGVISVIDTYVATPRKLEFLEKLDELRCYLDELCEGALKQARGNTDDDE